MPSTKRPSRRQTRSDDRVEESADRKISKPWWRRPATTCDYSRHFKYARRLRRGTRVLICARVSNREGKSTADRQRRLAAQARYLQREAEKLGLIVVGVIMLVGPGTDPVWIAQAVGKARREHADVLLFHTVSRAVRHAKFHSKLRSNLQATENELWYMQQFAFGYRLSTLVDPNASPAEEHAAHVKAGMQMSRKKPGRPRKDESKGARRVRLRDVARRMYRDGRTLGDISRDFKVARSTIQDWVRGCTDSMGENL